MTYKQFSAKHFDGKAETIMKVKNCSRYVVVSSLEEASQVIRKTIDEQGMGASKWYEYKNNGYVYEGEAEVGYISYNGRIWHENPNKQFKASDDDGYFVINAGSKWGLYWTDNKADAERYSNTHNAMRTADQCVTEVVHVKNVKNAGSYEVIKD